MKKQSIERPLTKLAQRFFATWRLFWEQRSKLIVVSAVIVAPMSFLRSYAALSTDLSVLFTFASLYCLLALIYFCHHMAQANRYSVAKIYTQASGRFLQLLGTTVGLSALLTPLIMSSALLLLIGSFDLPVFLYAPALGISLFSAWVLVGFSQAQYIASCQGESIIGSFRKSWRYTKGLRLRIGLQLTLFAAFLTFVISVVFFVINLSGVLAQSWFVQGLISALTVTPALAWLVVFGYSIYDEVSK